MRRKINLIIAASVLAGLSFLFLIYALFGKGETPAGIFYALFGKSGTPAGVSTPAGILGGKGEQVNFQQIGPGGGGAGKTIAYSSTDPNTIFVGVDVGGLYKTTDGGTSWHAVNTGLTEFGTGAQSIFRIIFSPDDKYVVICTGAGAYISFDQGESWQPLFNVGQSAEWGLIKDNQEPSDVFADAQFATDNPNILYLASGARGPNGEGNGSGVIYKGTRQPDGRFWWQRIYKINSKDDPKWAANKAFPDLILDPDDPKIIYVLSYGRGLIKSTDGGQNWSDPISIGKNDVRTIGIANIAGQKHIYVVTKKSGIFRSDDEGTNWINITGNLFNLYQPDTREDAGYLGLVLHPSLDGRIFVSPSRTWGPYGVFRTDDANSNSPTWVHISYKRKNYDPYINFDSLDDLGWDNRCHSPYDMAMSAQNPDQICYADATHIFCSDNVNAAKEDVRWKQHYTKMTPGNNKLWTNIGYDSSVPLTLTFDPKNPDRIWAGYIDGHGYETSNNFQDMYWLFSLGNYSNIYKILPDPYSEDNNCAAGAHPCFAKKTVYFFSAYNNDGWFDYSSSERPGMIKITRDGGQTFSTLTLKDENGKIHSNEIHDAIITERDPTTGKGKLFVAMYGHGVFWTNDEGRSWHSVNTGLPLADGDGKKISRLVYDPATKKLYTGFMLRSREWAKTDNHIWQNQADYDQHCVNGTWSGCVDMKGGGLFVLDTQKMQDGWKTITSESVAGCDPGPDCKPLDKPQTFTQLKIHNGILYASTYKPVYMGEGDTQNKNDYGSQKIRGYPGGLWKITQNGGNWQFTRILDRPYIADFDFVGDKIIALSTSHAGQILLEKDQNNQLINLAPGVYVSDNDGQDWTRLATNLPGIALDFTYLYINPDQSQIYIATQGDGFWRASTESLLGSFNKSPTANDQSVTTNEDASVAITLTATDLEQDPLKYFIASNPTHGSLSGDAPNITYTPAKDYNGTDNFTFKANDGHSDSNIAIVSLTINPVNDAPVMSSPGDKKTKGGSELKFTVTATDVDNDQLILNSSGKVFNLGAKFVDNRNKSGTFAWTPSIELIGQKYPVVFEAADPANLKDAKTIDIEIVAEDVPPGGGEGGPPINNAPVLAPIGNTKAKGGSEMKFTISASDVDQDRLSFSATGEPMNLGGRLTDNGNNTAIFSWMPGTNLIGQKHDITFIVSDPAGAEDSEKITIEIVAEDVSPGGGEGGAPNMPITTTGKVTATAAGGGKATATTQENTSASVEIPANSVNVDIDFTITPIIKTSAKLVQALAAVPKGKSIIGSYVYDFTASASGKAVATFSKSITLTFRYTDSQVSNFQESTLNIYYWDDISKWIALSTTVNTQDNTLIVQTSHSTYFAIMGEPKVKKINIFGIFSTLLKLLKNFFSSLLNLLK